MEEQIGVFAQDIQKVIPQVVKPAPFDTDNNGKSKTGDNYLAMADTDGAANIDIWSQSTDNWGAAKIDLGSTTGMEPCFYYVDGALRVSANNINKQDKSHSSKWYGMIDRTLFQGTDEDDGVQTITGDFYEELQELEVLEVCYVMGGEGGPPRRPAGLGGRKAKTSTSKLGLPGSETAGAGDKH